MTTGPQAGEYSVGRGADSLQAGRCTGGVHILQCLLHMPQVEFALGTAESVAKV